MKLRGRLLVSLSPLLLLGCGPAETGLTTGTGGALETTGSGGQAGSGGALGASAGGALPSASGGDPGESGGSPSGGNTAAGGESSGDGGQTSGGSPGSGGSLSGAGGSTLGSGGGSGGGEGACPFSGRITYSLAQATDPTDDQKDAYGRITTAIEKALSIYNCYTDIEKTLNVQYNPSVETADGNPNGSIRFGSRASMNFVTAMHEISHTLGVGADGAYDPLIVGGVYTGPIATARLRELTEDPSAEIHGDSQHFWPYGLNYESEYHSEEDGIFHCYIVSAIREDIGWD